eukprot:1392067-Amorphochlora_amoeboformis.AAC.1
MESVAVSWVHTWGCVGGLWLLEVPKRPFVKALQLVEAEIQLPERSKVGVVYAYINIYVS